VVAPLLLAAALSPPALDHLDPIVRAQVREREAWYARKVAAARGAEVREEAAGELGNLYQAYGLLDAAEAAYGEAARLDPRDFRWPYYLGLLHRARNDRERSVASLEKALALKPDDVAAAVRLAEVHSDAARPEAAEALFARAARLDPRNAVALAGLGQIALARRDYFRAADYLERALAAQPQAAALRYPLALAHRGKGDLARAEAEASRHGPTGPVLDDPLSRRLHGLSEGQAAEQQRGAAAIAAGDVAGAVAAFRRAVAEDPLYAASRVNLALALLRAGEAAPAEEQLRAALELSPEDAAAHAALGYLEAGRGAHERAVAHYRRALAADPQREDAHFNLGRSLLDLHRYAEAAAAFAAAGGAQPSADVRLAEASALVLAGRDADARARLEAAVQAWPRDGDLAHALARLLAGSADDSVRDPPRALTIAQAIAAASGAAEHLETLAMALAAAGRFAEAARAQRELLARTAETGPRERLGRTLARYEKGEPVRGPWRETGRFVDLR
jgi:tetratricopeptide (TPR) repeat protein